MRCVCALILSIGSSTKLSVRSHSRSVLFLLTHALYARIPEYMYNLYIAEYSNTFHVIVDDHPPMDGFSYQIFNLVYFAFDFINSSELESNVYKNACWCGSQTCECLFIVWAVSFLLFRYDIFDVTHIIFIPELANTLNQMNNNKIKTNDEKGKLTRHDSMDWLLVTHSHASVLYMRSFPIWQPIFFLNFFRCCFPLVQFDGLMVHKRAINFEF